MPATIEEGLFGLLNASQDIQAVLAPDAGGINCRLYPGHIDERATLPAAAFARAGGSRQLVQTGPDGLISARFQFSAADTTYDACQQVMDAIALKLHGFTGELPNGVLVSLISMSGEMIDDFDIEARLYARHCDFDVVYVDPAPIKN
jgi:hypothetical protein